MKLTQQEKHFLAALLFGFGLLVCSLILEIGAMQ